MITSLYVFNGRYITPPIINEVLDTKPAMQGRMLSGDKVISINKEKIKDFLDIKKIVENNPNKALSFEILRNDTIISTTIIPSEFYDNKLKKVYGRIGITATQPELKTLSILPVIKFGVLDSMNITFEWLKGLKALFYLQRQKIFSHQKHHSLVSEIFC